MKIVAIFNKTKFGATRNSNHVDAYEESTVHDSLDLKLSLQVIQILV